MAQLKLNFALPIFLVSLFSIFAPVEPSLHKRVETMAYIKASCKITLYPELCFHRLAKFAHSALENPQQLADTALSVSLSEALSTRVYLLKVANELKAIQNNKDYLTVQYCLRQINDSVDQLGQSIKEFHCLKRNGAAIHDEFLWHISNVETWLSTALTDASTCVESFPGQRISKLTASVKVRALNVAEVTSNALALFHGYAAKYRAAVAARAAKKP